MRFSGASASATARQFFHSLQAPIPERRRRSRTAGPIYGTYENEVLAANLKTRKIVWRYHHPERNFPFYSSAALSGGRVFVGGRDKMMHALDATSGKEVWSFQTGARIDSSPAIAGGAVYVGSNDGKLYVFDRRTWPNRPAVRGRRTVVGVACRSRADVWSSARRTGSCSAWDRDLPPKGGSHKSKNVEAEETRSSWMNRIRRTCLTLAPVLAFSPLLVAQQPAAPAATVAPQTAAPAGRAAAERLR